MIDAFADETITLADSHFRCQVEQPANVKICAKGTWNERMLIETMLSMVTRICHLKHLTHRARIYIEMRLAYVSALFNVLLALNQRREPAIRLDDRILQIAHYSL